MLRSQERLESIIRIAKLANYKVINKLLTIKVADMLKNNPIDFSSHKRNLNQLGIKNHN